MGIAYRPNPGYTFNPLIAFPRNLPCFCQSGKKYKRCCGPNMPRMASEKDAKAMAPMVREARDTRKLVRHGR